MSTATIIVICFFMTASANILMPHSIFATRSAGMMEQPTNYSDEVLEDNSESLPIADNVQPSNELPKKVLQQQHNRNCFFTPVQCMLPLTDSYKDVQSLHGVYSPTATHVRRSVDSIPMLTSPWEYTDLIKRGGDNRFYQWLSRF